VASKFNFDRVIQNIKRLKVKLPKVLALETKNHFLNDNFNKQEFEGAKWAPVKRQSKKGGSSRNQSATLVQSGKLRRAVNNSIQTATFESIVLQVKDVPYGKVHNDGLKAGRGAGFIMPKRQFIGDSEPLRKLQRKVISEFVDKVWK